LIESYHLYRQNFSDIDIESDRRNCCSRPGHFCLPDKPFNDLKRLLVARSVATPQHTHPGEIIHCTSMAAIGGIKIVLYRLQSFAPQGKRSAQQEQKNGLVDRL